MRVALFARVSSEEQAKADRVSLPAQLRVMRERCAAEGWEVVREFEAHGESAYTDDLAKRPTLRAAVEAAERGEFDVLMVHESSRFARSVLLALQVEARLRAAGVVVLAANEALRQRDADTEFVKVVDRGVQQWYSAKLSEHLRKAKLQQHVEGLHLGDPPFGYRRVGPRVPYEVVPEEAAAVRSGFRDYVAGASYTEIAARWNAQGLRPRSKQGHTRFTVPAMQTIFENRFYAGFVSHKGSWRLGAHEAIVSEELWEAAQARVRHRAFRGREERMLSGLARCVRCSGPLWLTGKPDRSGRTSYYYLRETSRERGRDCENAKSMVRAELVEAEVERQVMAMAMSPEWIRRVDREARTVPASTDDGRRKALEAERRRITNAYLAGALGDDEWRSRLGEVDAQLRRLPDPGRAPEAVQFAGERLIGIGQVWQVATPADRREACQLLFRSVAVDTRTRWVGTEPWPEFARYFAARREEVRRARGVVSLVGPPGFEPSKRETFSPLFVAADLELAG